MTRQVSDSNEVSERLLARKDKKSFSFVTKENLSHKEENKDIIRFAGIMKKERKRL